MRNFLYVNKSQMFEKFFYENIHSYSGFDHKKVPVTTFKHYHMPW